MRRAGIVLMLAVAGLVAGCGGDATPGSTTGSTDGAVVAGAPDAEVSGADAAVVLPSGAFTFTFTEPRATVSAADSADGEAHDAGDGSQYLGVAWTQDGPAPAFGAVLHGTDPLPASMSVRAGDHDAELPDLAQGADAARPQGLVWVRVPEGSDPVLDIDYDGLTTSVDATTGAVAAGPADALSEVVTTQPAACPSSGPGRGARGFQYSIACEASAATVVPYVAGPGWAEDGSRWLVTDVTVTPADLRWSPTGTLDGSVPYRAEKQSGGLVAGGKAAEVIGESDVQGDVHTATYAVPVTGDGPWTLTVRRTYRLVRDGEAVRGSPPTKRVAFRATLHVSP